MITFVHQCAVFGVPIFFGWVVLRQLAREHDLLLLIPGSVVLGWAALMGLTNELRFFLGMNLALWYAYKALLFGALVILVCHRKARRAPALPRPASKSWKWMLTAAGALVTSVYFGYPAAQGILNDAWWFHYPTAVQIQTAEFFPLRQAYAIDNPLYYHYGPDLLAAIWSFLLEWPVQSGFTLSIVVLAPCAFLLGFALILRLSRNYWSALFAAVLLVVGGNLSFVKFFGADFSQPATLLGVVNSQTVEGLVEMMFTPSHALGIPLTLLCLALFGRLLARPSWSLAATLGLLLGTLSLVAEWYFFPLVAVFGCCALALEVRHRRSLPPLRWHRRAVLVAPLVIALSWSFFNNSYVAGLVGRYWMRYEPASALALQRQTLWEIKTDNRSLEEFAPPTWSIPPLIPLQLNLGHLGSVPSWKNAGSAGGSYIPLLSPAFLLEALPVLLPGLVAGLFIFRRRGPPLAFALLGLLLMSLFPPIFLDWGHRTTDLLRFFTGALSFASLFFGWRLGAWISGPSRFHRGAGALLLAGCLIQPLSMGLIGLMPSALSTAVAVGDAGASLASAGKLQSSADFGRTSDRVAAFSDLSRQMGNFLFHLEQGRSRVVLIVPPDELPPRDTFPEWMKLTTQAKVLLPLGWYYDDSPYVSYYRQAITDLDLRSLVSLDVKWIVVTNAFDFPLPPAVADALKDRTRFTLAHTFRAGDTYIELYFVR